MLTYKLRHRVTIQQRTQTQNSDTGEIVVTWADLHADEPAEVVPLSGKEYIAGAATQAAIDTRMTIRWRESITTLMRVVFDGRNYNIHAVLPDPTNRKWLTLMCQAGLNDGT